MVSSGPGNVGKKLVSFPTLAPPPPPPGWTERQLRNRGSLKPKLIYRETESSSAAKQQECAAASWLDSPLSSRVLSAQTHPLCICVWICTCKHTLCKHTLCVIWLFAKTTRGNTRLPPANEGRDTNLQRLLTHCFQLCLLQVMQFLLQSLLNLTMAMS